MEEKINKKLLELANHDLEINKQFLEDAIKDKDLNEIKFREHEINLCEKIIKNYTGN